MLMNLSLRHVKLCASVVLIIACMATSDGCDRETELVTTYEAMTDHQLKLLRGFIEIELVMPGPGLPTGGVAKFEEWLNERCKDEDTYEQVKEKFMGSGSAIIRASHNGRLQLIDGWGHRMVYRYPSDVPGRRYRLYSIGPNGVDEDGKGDDIEPVSNSAG